MNHRLPSRRLSRLQASPSLQGFSSCVNHMDAQCTKIGLNTVHRRRAMVLLSECGVFLGLLLCVVYLASMWSVLNPFTGVLEAMSRPAKEVQASLLAESKTVSVLMDVHVPD